MDIDYEEYISQSIIKTESESVSVETKQIKDYLSLSNDGTIKEQELAYCERCAIDFKNRKALLDHITYRECPRTHETRFSETIKAERIHEVKNPRKKKEPVKKQTPKKQCELCGTCVVVTKFRSHFIQCHDYKDCRRCGKMFVTEDEFNSHLPCPHSGLRVKHGKYYCLECDRVFSTAAVLSRHKIKHQFKRQSRRIRKIGAVNLEELEYNDFIYE